jgi:uncharacterized protein with GYD domain
MTRRLFMPKYLVLADYAPEGIKGVLDKGGTSRVEALETLCQSVGGTLESFYFAFGETDAYVTVDLPDNTTAAALCMTAAASGLVGVSTVALLTPEEVDAAAEASIVYRPPGS